MDGQSGASNNPNPTSQAPPHQQHSALIRTDQVQKLPHLTDAQKANHTQAVRTLWDILQSQPPNSSEYINAHTKLSQISATLMKGMKLYQQSRAQQQHLQQQAQQIQQQQMQQAQQAQQQAQQAAQQQQQQQQQPQQQQQQQQQQQPQQQPQQQQGGQQAQMTRPGPQGAGTQPTQQRTSLPMPQNFQQLLPQIQAKVNSINFLLPPSMVKPQSDNWLQEARYRYGLALQKQELGKVKMNELRQSWTARQAAGNITPEEMQEFQRRQAVADKLIREGSEFLNKFKEQQEQFRAQAQGIANRPGAPTAAGVQGQVSGDVNRGQVVAAGAPAPHTINSAVVAARSQTGQSAPTQFPNQGTSQQAPQQQAPHSQLPTTQLPQQQLPPNAQQRPFSQPQVQETAAQMPGTQGPPRPLSQQAAMAQAAQNYSNAVNQQTMAAQAAQAANTHAHPNISRPDTRNVNMQIPKTLNVAPPEPVTMGPARPTLTASASHGTMGTMGQPAIQRHPGYVLEGEGQRVLSKKKLDALVRQVTGGGEGQGLTPDAEELILQMADDFVDDVITAACRLAKLRPSSTLDIRDIQLVLERNYNIRIPGFSSDDLRTVKKPHPTQGWTQKMSAVQAAKVTQARLD
ncbi:hypothetical protein VTO42DRAFT_1582 [Malbranchea cinnamomea]